MCNLFLRSKRRTRTSYAWPRRSRCSCVVAFIFSLLVILTILLLTFFLLKQSCWCSSIADIIQLHCCCKKANTTKEETHLHVVQTFHRFISEQNQRNRSTYRSKHSSAKHRAQQRVRIVIANLRWWFLSKATRLRSDVSPIFPPPFTPRALSCLDKATPLLTNRHLSGLMKSTAAASCWRAVLPRCWHRRPWEAHPTLRPFTPRANNLVAPSAPDPIIEEGWGKTTRVNKEHGYGDLSVRSWYRGENVHVRRELHRVEKQVLAMQRIRQKTGCGWYESNRRQYADTMDPARRTIQRAGCESWGGRTLCSSRHWINELRNHLHKEGARLLYLKPYMSLQQQQPKGNSLSPPI
jgi:hypothetical protein